MLAFLATVEFSLISLLYAINFFRDCMLVMLMLIINIINLY